MVTIKAIEKGLADYLDSELINKLPENGIERFGIGLYSSLAIKKLSSTLESLNEKPAIKMLGIIDEDGKVDIDIIRTEAKNKIPDTGLVVDVPILGTMTFKKEDIDILYNCIKEHDNTYKGGMTV